MAQRKTPIGDGHSFVPSHGYDFEYITKATISLSASNWIYIINVGYAFIELSKVITVVEKLKRKKVQL